MRYLKVYQNINILFNLSYKPTFYGVQLTRYIFVANSAIFSFCDIKPVPKTLIPVAGHFLRGFVNAFHMPKAFSIRKI